MVLEVENIGSFGNKDKEILLLKLIEPQVSWKAILAFMAPANVRRFVFLKAVPIRLLQALKSVSRGIDGGFGSQGLEAFLEDRNPVRFEGPSHESLIPMTDLRQL